MPPRARLKIVGVHGDRQAELLRDLVVAQRRGRRRAAPGEPERQQAAVRVVAPALRAGRARSRKIDARVVARARRRAVREPRANAGFRERAQRGFRVVGAADVVAPVVHERDARVHGLGRGEPPRGVHVVGRIERADGSRRRESSRAPAGRRRGCAAASSTRANAFRRSPGSTSMPAPSMISAPGAVRPRPTAAIAPARTCTSPPAMSPTAASIVST